MFDIGQVTPKKNSSLTDLINDEQYMRSVFLILVFVLFTVLTYIGISNNDVEFLKKTYSLFTIWAFFYLFIRFIDAATVLLVKTVDFIIYRKEYRKEKNEASISN